MESVRHAEWGEVSPEPGLKLKIVLAQKELAGALEEIDDVKAREWERQRNLLSTGTADHDTPTCKPLAPCRYPTLIGDRHQRATLYFEQHGAVYLHPTPSRCNRTPPLSPFNRPLFVYSSMPSSDNHCDGSSCGAHGVFI